ncbi:MAG TPA: DUF6655 family protein [Stellaceae bacterium]|nr:DUF6655 family protein [Stellaceae bacterium]
MRHATATRLTAAGLLPALLLVGCATERSSEPKSTATEQLLISTAIDHVIDQLRPAVPTGTKVFVDPQYFDTAPADEILYPKYAIGAVRDRLLKQGARIVEDRRDADIVVEPRTGGQSVDHDTFLVGIPSFNIPIPLAPVSFPEIALFKKDRHVGVSKLSITAYAEKDGGLVDSVGPMVGYSERTHRVVLLLYEWTDSDAPTADIKH